jgi:hypothetical protein
MEQVVDSRAVAAIVESGMTVSDKIRALNDLGHPRADIARLLGKRYQHVRNVLEADKLGGREFRRAVPTGGVAEGTRQFEGPASPEREVEDRGGGAYRLVVRDDGSVVLPPAVREAFGLRGPGAVLARLEGDEFKLYSAETGLRRARALLAPHMRPGVSWADELIADRREEQVREDRDG